MRSMPQDFEAHLAREIIDSERARMAVLALVFAMLTVAFPLFALVFRQEYRETFHSPVTILLVTGFSAAVVVYELFARHMQARLARRYGTPPAAVRYWNTFAETSVPSLLMLVAMRDLDPALVLQGPPVLLYGVFIVLATLRLDFALCVFTGVLAALEYSALAFINGAAAGHTLIRALLLLVSGFAAAFVAAQLRARIAKTYAALAERERVVSAFGQHVSPMVVNEIVRRGADIPSRRSFVCVMFMDIRDFTPLVESRTPEEIVALQNAVFSVAIDVVNRHQGVINQFLGDGFMASFGAPVSSGEDCRNAVAAARELIASVRRLADAGAIPPLRIGVGLHAGDAVSGNIGSALRKQYSITGNVVILASRIEQLNKRFGSQLLISREVLRQCGDEAKDAAPLGSVHVKGREQAVEVYRIA
jgi:adenylate cyclase